MHSPASVAGADKCNVAAHITTELATTIVAAFIHVVKLQ
jgi:hypothetical protein